MANKILISILCLSGTVVLSQSVKVNGNCSVTQPPEPLTVSGVRSDPLQCTLWNTGSCDNGNLPPSVGGPFMGPPASLSVEGLLFPYLDKLYPKLQVTWQPPRSAAGMSEMKGFLMNFHKLAGPGPTPDFFCRVFDFSQSNFTSTDHQLEFTKSFVQFSGGPQFLYLLELYTLPYSPNSEKLTKIFSLQGTQSKNNTANWVAAMSYSVENVTAPAHISVQFSLAPEYFNFKKYNLQLVSKDDDKNAYLTCIVSVDEDYECQGRMHDKPGQNATSVTHTFLDVAAGTYNVWLQPVDPYWQNDDKCLCFREVVNGGRVCERCVTTYTSEFVVDGDIPVETSTTQTEGTTQPHPQTSPELVTKDVQSKTV